MINNLVYAVGTVPPSMALALLFALALQRSARINSVMRALLLFPSMVPLVAAASLFFFIFLPGVGLFDYYLAKLGVRGANWLGDPDVALWSLIGITIWKNAGYYMLFYLAGLQTLPATCSRPPRSTAPTAGSGCATSSCRCWRRPRPSCW